MFAFPLKFHIVASVTVEFVTIKRREMRKTRAYDVLELESFLPYQVNLASEIISQGFAKIYGGRYGLSRPEWRTLATLGQFGTLTATSIGAHSSMHKTKVSRAVAALENRRWLKRENDADDRRVEHLILTPAGLEAYADIVKFARSYEERMLLLLGPDTVMFKAMLARIMSASL
ncbi:MarR family winged helix-turn-helix transcriptional regulator [Devosia sp. A369]